MNFSTFLALVSMALGCAACGGQSNTTNTVSKDTKAPVISEVMMSAPSDGQVTLTVNSTDTDISGYCFHPDPRTPEPSDSCFSMAYRKTVALSEPVSTYYVWVKDDAGNVSKVVERSLPCYVSEAASLEAGSKPQVCMLTSLGGFVVALENSKAPISTNNFLKYVNDGFYADTVFHRVMKDFMVQAGGYTGVPIEGKAKTGTKYDPIKLEAPATTGLSNLTGTLAMARTSEANSATSEFFINVVDNLSLDTNGGGYAVFGRVISGMDTTIQAIRNVQVQNNASNEMSQPLKPPVIQWAYRLK